MITSFPEPNATYLNLKVDTKKQDQPSFFYLEDLRTSRYKESKYPPMNYSIIPGLIPAAGGQHMIDIPLYRIHHFRQEAHPRSQAESHEQRHAEYPLEHWPTHGHRDEHLRNKCVRWNQNTARCWLTPSRIPPPSIRPHPTAPWETFYNSRDIRPTEKHEKSDKNLGDTKPTDVHETRADIRRVRPIQTERPVRVFGLEYAGGDEFHCHQIKSPGLERKKDDGVANLSVNEETADGLWSEVEDLLHHMSPKPPNHSPSGHEDVETVNHTGFRRPFMTSDDMPPRIQEILANASKLPPRDPLAGSSIPAYRMESDLHPDIICAIHALRDEEP